MSSHKFVDEYSEYLEHYGTPRHSGRYPWGSGKKYQRSRNFLTQYEDLRKKGLSKTEIAKSLGLKNTSELNARRAAARERERSCRYSVCATFKRQRRFTNRNS